MKKDSQTLALEAIAAMRVDEQTNFREVAALCVAIARVELAKDYEGMVQAIESVSAAVLG